MRSFALAAILLTLGIAGLVLIAYNALQIPVYSAPAVREFDLFYEILGWAKYLAPLFLLYLADRAVLWREYVGWRRTVLLWTPLALFALYAYLQWFVLGDERIRYLQEHGRWEGGASAAVIFMAATLPVAFAIAALNAARVRRREIRLTSR